MIFGIVIVFEVYVFQVKRGLPKLFNEINIISLTNILCSRLFFYMDPRYIDIYVPGDCIFLF